jgi:holo-[acyl-carrier protein] synthase
MIVSIGIDIIEVYRIRETLERTPRFGDRVFTQIERDYCDAKGVAAAQSYAFLKALGTGWRGKITWHDIEIINNELGVPRFNLSGEALKIMQNLGADKAHLSISHTGEHAVAQVILEA